MGLKLLNQNQRVPNLKKHAIRNKIKCIAKELKWKHYLIDGETYLGRKESKLKLI